jgi:hypothetical protein
MGCGKEDGVAGCHKLRAMFDDMGDRLRVGAAVLAMGGLVRSEVGSVRAYKGMSCG